MNCRSLTNAICLITLLPTYPLSSSIACCRGPKGLAYTEALNKRSPYLALPEYGTPEYDSTNLGRLHASIPALLSSSLLEPEHVAEASAEQVRWLRMHAGRAMYWTTPTTLLLPICVSCVKALLKPANRCKDEIMMLAGGGQWSSRPG